MAAVMVTATATAAHGGGDGGYDIGNGDQHGMHTTTAVEDANDE